MLRKWQLLKRPLANRVQSGNLASTERSSLSAASHQLPGHSPRRRRRRRRGCHDPNVSDGCPAPDRGSEEFDYQFYRTALNLHESYFAESQQHHWLFSSRNNPGILLCDDPDPPGPDSSDDDDVSELNRSDDDVSICTKAAKRVVSKNRDHPETTTIFAAASREDRIDDVAGTGRAEHTRSPAELCDEDGDEDDDVKSDTNESTEENVEAEKPSYIPDDDLFRARWFADSWDRLPGQLWTKEIQNQHNLRAAIREKGFTGARAAWLFHQLSKRKGYRFPYKERISLKRPDQTHGQYLSALKQRRDEEQTYENQVKEYDEGNALEECEWAFNLYNKVSFPGWPEDAATVKPIIQNAIGDGTTIDGELEEEESFLNRQEARQHVSNPQPQEKKQLSAAHHGITIPLPAERASVEEIEQRNQDFRAYKAKTTEAARREAEEQEIREFIQAANSQTFSNGYRQMWKESPSLQEIPRC